MEVGELVEVVGMVARAELNGKRGTVCGWVGPRVAVGFEDGTKLAVAETKLRRLPRADGRRGLPGPAPLQPAPAAATDVPAEGAKSWKPAPATAQQPSVLPAANGAPAAGGGPGMEKTRKPEPAAVAQQPSVLPAANGAPAAGGGPGMEKSRKPAPAAVAQQSSVPPAARNTPAAGGGPASAAAANQQRPGCEIGARGEAPAPGRLRTDIALYAAASPAPEQLDAGTLLDPPPKDTLPLPPPKSTLPNPAKGTLPDPAEGTLPVPAKGTPQPRRERPAGRRFTPTLRRGQPPAACAAPRGSLRAACGRTLTPAARAGTLPMAVLAELAVGCWLEAAAGGVRPLVAGGALRPGDDPPASRLPDAVRGIAAQVAHPALSASGDRWVWHQDKAGPGCRSKGEFADWSIRAALEFQAKHAAGGPPPAAPSRRFLEEDAYYRLGLAYASDLVCIVVLRLLNTLRIGGWKSVAVDPSGEHVVPSDGFRMHMLEFVPDSARYTVLHYGDGYQLVELLEDSHGGLFSHYVLVNNGVVADPAGAGVGAYGHRPYHGKHSWLDFEKSFPALPGFPPRIRPLPQLPDWIAKRCREREQEVEACLAAALSRIAS
ncbi:hypothetical protein DIPPA_29567 [Diplonema papillatum]|nr:hypothetical protein DIPPA_29567 [Diplonema papillatum]